MCMGVFVSVLCACCVWFVCVCACVCVRVCVCVCWCVPLCVNDLCVFVSAL